MDRFRRAAGIPEVTGTRQILFIVKLAIAMHRKGIQREEVLEEVDDWLVTQVYRAPVVAVL